MHVTSLCSTSKQAVMNVPDDDTESTLDDSNTNRSHSNKFTTSALHILQRNAKHNYWKNELIA